jgi:hypothetical protein
MNKANDLKTYLEAHCLGRSSAQTAAQITQSVRACDSRQVREWAMQLRHQGEPVCSHSSDGYWWANSPEDLSLAMGFLKGRALNSLRQVSQLKKIALPGVVGQLSLALPESLLVEIPEELHLALLRYQVDHPGQDLNQVLTQALALFLGAEAATRGVVSQT